MEAPIWSSTRLGADDSVSFKDHFSGHAAAYAAHRPTWPEALVDVLADASPAHDLVWDVGCGSGQLSTLLPRRFGQVIATDASAEQLKHAAPAARLTYRCAPAERSGLDDRCADCIVVAQAAHWFDMTAFVSECRRVGRPRALVALVTYGVMFIEPDLDDVINHFTFDTLGDFWPPERRHVDTGYANLSFPLEPVTLPAVTMRAEWKLAQVVAYVGTWSAVAALRKAGHAARFDEFTNRLSARWGDDVRPREVSWPLAMRAGRVE